jgi:hypothetical protein
MIDIKPAYKEILKELYDITEGNIVIGGSLSLKLRGIIDRSINDIDVNLSESDWLKYEQNLNKKFKFYSASHIINKDNTQNHTILTCIPKNKNNQFHLFINHIDFPYETIIVDSIKYKLMSAQFILKDKLWILEDKYNTELDKHSKDVESIKSWINKL